MRNANARRWLGMALVAVATAASACGAGTPTSLNPPSPSPSPSPSASRQSEPVETGSVASRPIDPRSGGFDVGFGEFAITLEAKAIRPGRVTLVVRNGGKLVHGFEMKQENEGGHHGHGGGDDRFKLEQPTFGPGDTIRIKATLPAGVYEIECYVANHEALGMRATLRVTPDAPLVEPTTAAANTVAIRGFAFGPSTVAVDHGESVTWTNHDPTEHTVTAADGSFTSQPLASGKGYRVTFGRAGTVSYFCAIHPSMKGTITVR
jgi:plastocyanin